MMRKFTTFALLFALLFVSCKSNINTNPYNLDIISDVQSYLETVRNEPENQLIDLESYIPNIVLDIRYATTNNFTGKQIYTAPKAYLRKAAADSLKKIQEILEKEGLGIKVFDAYRPYAATLFFYEVWGDTTFVAAPWKGSIHNRACAIDLTLIDLKTGEELEMPSLFDEFSERAALDFMDAPDFQIKNREKLVKIMTENGFTSYSAEWWHFNIKGRDKFKLMDISFEQLENK